MHRDRSPARRRRSNPVHSASNQRIPRTDVAPSHALKTNARFIAIPELETRGTRAAVRTTRREMPAIAPRPVSEAVSLDTFPSEETERSRAEGVLFDRSVAHSTLDDFPSEGPPRIKLDTPAYHQQIGRVRTSEIALVYGAPLSSCASPISTSPTFPVVLRFDGSRRQLHTVTRRLRRFLEMANRHGVIALKTAREWIAAIVSRYRLWRACVRLTQFDRLAAKLRQG
jgi:hypothetical protein